MDRSAVCSGPSTARYRRQAPIATPRREPGSCRSSHSCPRCEAAPSLARTLETGRKTIAFTSTTTAEDLAKKDKPEESKSDVRIITLAEFRSDDEGYLDPAEHGHIWTVPAAMPGDKPATAHQVTSGAFDEEAPQWSRDGTRLYFVSDRKRESYYYPPDNNVYSVPA